MPYLMLAIAIGAEIMATTLLKYSDGFTKHWPTVGCVLSYILCYTTFAKALDKLNLGVAYATWCGVGMVATALISVLVFKERMPLPGAVGILLIVAGCIMLNLYGSGH